MLTPGGPPEEGLGLLGVDLSDTRYVQETGLYERVGGLDKTTGSDGWLKRLVHDDMVRLALAGPCARGMLDAIMIRRPMESLLLL